MSTANAFLILFGVLATLVLVVLVFIFRWEPESLIFWRNLTLALVFLELAVPPLLPPEIRWGDNANIFKAAVLLLLVAIGIKSLILPRCVQLEAPTPHSAGGFEERSPGR